MFVIFNIDRELNKYNLTKEKYEQLLTDCSNKVNKTIDKDWSEIALEYGLDFNPDTCRKAQQPPILGGAFVKQYMEEKYASQNADDSDAYMKKVNEMLDKAYKAKKQASDQRREYNKVLTSDARAEHLNEELIKAANKLNEIIPLKTSKTYYPINTEKEACLFWSDWHYGMVTDNIWNQYNTEICRERIAKMVELTKHYLRLNNIDVLNIIMLGDAANGAIHTSCRVASEEDTCDQLMNVSELMAQAINELSTVVNYVGVYSCYGNHLRTVQKKDDSIHSDNMEKIIPWWLRQRLANNNKVEIIDSEYKEFTKLNVLGYNICCIHGDLENFKNIGVTVNTIFSKKFGETIDYTVSGDKHHLEEFEQFDIESILIRSLCGTDDFANNKRLYSKPGQTLMIFNNVYGRESTYHIPLN